MAPISILGDPTAEGKVGNSNKRGRARNYYRLAVSTVKYLSRTRVHICVLGRDHSSVVLSVCAFFDGPALPGILIAGDVAC